MGNRLLIKGGYVVVTAERDDDLPQGDVLVEDGVIVAVGPSLSAPADETIDATGQIVIPGFVDSHRHAWETVMRNHLPDGSLMDYLVEIIGGFAHLMTAEDVYASDLLGAASALTGGVTTLLDWSQISNTPEHSDAAVEGLLESGIRGVYAHGIPGVNRQEWSGHDVVRRHPDDIRRIVDTWASHDRLTVAMAMRGAEFGSYESTWDDIRFARELGVRISVHVGCGALEPGRPSNARIRKGSSARTRPTSTPTRAAMRRSA